MYADTFNDLALEAELENFAHRWFSMLNRMAPAIELAELLGEEASIQLLDETLTGSEYLANWEQRRSELLVNGHALGWVRAQRNSLDSATLRMGGEHRAAMCDGSVLHTHFDAEWVLDLSWGEPRIQRIKLLDVRTL
ncbi:hypothetical protein [Cobetia amphilecti]|uniref:Uncharacterized protein n=1 Tax=Cobetia amphilecti TaxID=1055104 RepID=A0AAP4U033_9GAMM|nr:hypothetical protein [Cobetia amphilecti]MDO6672895.1 hypothetical protein [Cobetia amphilecti]